VTDGSVRQVGIGVLGYEGVAKAHLLAIQRVSTIFWPLPARPLLVAVAGRSADRVERAAALRRAGRLPRLAAAD